MKTIMSSYHCEPDRGSEFETGWQELLQLAAKCSDLIVVTRPFNREKAEKVFREKGISNTTFLFFDLPVAVNGFKKTSVGKQVVPYIWELILFFFLLKRYSRNQFQHAHRASVGSYRFPSLLWYFSPYFTWGPIASGEIVPIRFLSVFSWKGRVQEVLRLVLQHTSFVDPFVLSGLYKAQKIGVATTATRNILPPFVRKKAYLQPDYYVVNKNDFQVDFSAYKAKEEGVLKLLFVGRLLEWKGIMFILKALRQLEGKINYEFTIIGEGPDRAVFQQYAEKYKLKVSFLGAKPRRDLSSYYASHDLFVSLDMHGRGSFTMVEAKMHNLPVLALDITDPDKLTGEELMIIITTKQQSVKAIINQIAQVLLDKYTEQNPVPLCL
ncbi:glycosyltransferase [Cytophagaceae bacterium BD1B2-1]|uniref:Glycosyltransferase n=2 Tax=Xanthocytophaga agilis TaxID=3048010 RepID=A0AAE3R740_9BACT|nr:glycosyltransferase [Xanthocytophaga agilis]